MPLHKPIIWLKFLINITTTSLFTFNSCLGKHDILIEFKYSTGHQSHSLHHHYRQWSPDWVCMHRTMYFIEDLTINIINNKISYSQYGSRSQILKRMQILQKIMIYNIDKRNDGILSRSLATFLFNNFELKACIGNNMID